MNISVNYNLSFCKHINSRVRSSPPKPQMYLFRSLLPNKKERFEDVALPMKSTKIKYKLLFLHCCDNVLTIH